LLAKHAELESERVDEILSKVGSSDVQYESACEYVESHLLYFLDSFSSLIQFRAGPSSRTRRSAIKARKSIVTRRDSVEQTDKTIQTIKRHRKQRHAKLKEMAKEEEGNSTRDSWINGFTGREIICPICSATVRGDEDVVDAHVDACLADESRRQEEVRQRDLQHRRAIEEVIRDDYGEDESLGNYVGDLRGQLDYFRQTSGNFNPCARPGAGFHTRNRNEQDVEEELDIDGDDKAVFGDAQFTEGDVLSAHTERGSIEGDFQVNIEDDGEDEGQGAQQTLHDLVSQSGIKIRKRTEENAGRRESFRDSLELDSVAMKNKVKLVERSPVSITLMEC